MIKNANTIVVTIILIIFASIVPLQAQEPIKVAIIPFEMNAEKDLSFLRDGIVDMLASRLTWTDKVIVFSEEQTANALLNAQDFTGESQALLVGGKLGADYVLYGSLTVFGDSVSIDSKMVNVTGNDEPFVFFTQTQSMGTVIPQINQFATDINAQVFGRGATQVTRAPAQAAPAPVPVPVPAPQAQPQQQYDPRTHPEKLMQEPVTSEDRPVDSEGTPMAVAPAAATATPGDKSWSSQRFKLRLNGIAIGDVDDDGKQELLLMAPDAVEIWRYENQRLAKVAVLAQERSRRFVGIDIADINGNGTPEIFLSGLNVQRNALNSVVYEYNGQAYTPIVEASAWYYRVVKLPDRGAVLLGQGQKVGDNMTPFSSTIYELAWQGADYESTDKVLAAGNANLLSLAYGDLMNNGTSAIVAYNESGNLQVMDFSGDVRWRSGDRFGGRNLEYLIPQQESMDFPVVFYYNVRIAIADLDKDGRNEVITTQNHEVAGDLLKRFRKFSKGMLVGLGWDGNGLVRQWFKREVSGQLDDFAIGDFDNDGTDEIVVAVILKQGASVASDPKSTLIAYEP
jgi:TolB-like protein